jgi:hypothetical protein
MGLGSNGVPPKATEPSEWAMKFQEKMEKHPDVKRRGQSGSARAFIDINWGPMWGTEGTNDMTDLRVAQKPNKEGDPLQDVFMLNGGSYRPPLTAMTDKQVVVRDGNGKLCTFHDIIKEPHNHLRTKNGCWKVKYDNHASEPVGMAWSVLFVPCLHDQDFVEIALQTNYYQATSEKNPNKIWCVNYGSGPMIAAGSTPGGYQFHMNRNEDDKPVYVKVEVSSIQASNRLGELSDMSYADRKAAIAEKLTKEGDIITLIQVPIMPSDDLPMESSYTDPLAVEEDSDAPVYRSMSAFTVELKQGSEIVMDEMHANLAHIQDPMHYVPGGHQRAAGLPRIDKMKVIAVRGEVTDEIITMASDWLEERNQGQLMPLEEVAAVQIEQQTLFPISPIYEKFLHDVDLKRSGESAEDSSDNVATSFESGMTFDQKDMEY